MLAWLKADKDDSKVYGIGEDWAFDFPLSWVKQGWQVWRMTNKIPTPTDALSYDPRWVSDIELMEKLYKWVNRDKNENAP